MKLIATLAILIGAAAAVAVEPLEEAQVQSCASRPWGCDNGYCWKQCGDPGEWCWQAVDGGQGGWLTCANDAACNVNNLQNVGCSGDCSC
jgi:hypothetical protein